MSLNKKKKIALVIGVAIIVLATIYKVVSSPNFLLPVNISQKDYSIFFRSEAIEKHNVVYSFRNFRNYLMICDIDNRTRCWVRKFNKHKEVTKFNQGPITDSIMLNAYSEVLFGTQPKLTYHNKFFDSNTVGYFIKADENAMTDTIISKHNYLNITGKIKKLGMYRNEKECESLFSFDKSTLVNFIFYNNESDSYIIVLYGINNNELQSPNEILSDVKNWY